MMTIAKMGRTMLALGALAAVVGGAMDADAATARVRCRVRADRTQVSIDGRQLAAGTYTASVDSATDAAGVVTSKAGVPVAGGRADEAGFDFDSNRANIAAGATALPASFASVGGSVSWQLLRNGVTILSGTQACTR